MQKTHFSLLRSRASRLLLAAGLLVSMAACATGAGAGARAGVAPGDEHVAVAHRVLATTPLFDGHNDLPWAIRQFDAAPRSVAAYDLRSRTPGHTDIARLREGMVGAQFWSVYVPPATAEEGAAKMQLEQIDIAKQIFRRYPEVFEETLTPGAAVSAWERGKIASVMGMEGGHAIENSLGALRAFFDLGARYMTLTHSVNVDWGTVVAQGSMQPLAGAQVVAGGIGTLTNNQGRFRLEGRRARRSRRSSRC
jgi:hypothetical protein